MANKERRFYGTGRRKSSVARVTLVPGKGNITVNGRDVNEYFPHKVLVMDLMQPLEVTGNANTFDVIVNVNGGGYSGQTGAIRLGIARALLEYDKDKTFSLDYKSEHFETFMRRILVRYNKEKNRRYCYGTGLSIFEGRRCLLSGHGGGQPAQSPPLRYGKYFRR